MAHRSSHRVRLRIPSKRHDRAFFTRLATGLSACPAVNELRVNPATASVLITSSGQVAMEAVAAFAHKHALFEVEAGRRAQMTESLRAAARRADARLRRSSGPPFDLRALAFIACAGGALYQVLRGEVLAPAVTLAWYAAALATTAPSRSMEEVS